MNSPPILEPILVVGLVDVPWKHDLGFGPMGICSTHCLWQGWGTALDGAEDAQIAAYLESRGAKRTERGLLPQRLLKRSPFCSQFKHVAFFNTKSKVGNHDFQGNVQVYNIRIPVPWISGLPVGCLVLQCKGVCLQV